MNRAVTQRLCERLVDEAVLVEQRQAVEAWACDDHLEVVAAAGSVFDAELARVRKRTAEKCFETIGGHAAIVLTAAYP